MGSHPLMGQTPEGRPKRGGALEPRVFGACGAQLAPSPLAAAHPSPRLGCGGLP